MSFIIEILFFSCAEASAATVAPLSPWVTIPGRYGNAGAHAVGNKGMTAAGESDKDSPADISSDYR
ncbi:hypothetical protein OG429_16960 [Streptomyces sp. NBC_00190]|uniref:hypothetical protein n=1 Tax=unclassified Streptomyces TaxID=2593676 RepID=UPI002E27E759|nr:hypothetical protein [Streptomyces sp. NBC_00190]WSZ40811.1 hypothetical protein OG239_19660 [Streptomyces sp. NBC_00868]